MRNNTMILPKQKVVELSITALLTVAGAFFGNKVELHLFEQKSNCAEMHNMLHAARAS